jgi:protein-S-isoprenylcysteine O-methyltransferase Ste14
MRDEGDRSTHILGSLLFLVVVPGTVAVLIHAAITRWTLEAWGPWELVVAISAALITAGAGALLHAVWRFAVEGRGTPSPTAPTEQLVVRGAYRHVRNPMYLAVAALIGGQALLSPSIGILLYLGLFAAAVTAFVRSYEEPTLRAAHGESYQRDTSRRSRDGCQGSGRGQGRAGPKRSSRPARRG